MQATSGPDLHTAELQARRYLKANTVAAAPGRRCVDGRYDTETGTIARPGADAAFVQALLALRNRGRLSLGVQEIVDRVVDATLALGGKFTFHTDEGEYTRPEAAGGEDASIGCTHLALAVAPQTSYDYLVNPLEMADGIMYMKRLAKSGAARMTVLEHEHQEEGVLVITGKARTVRPNDGRNMYFVYDRARDEAYLRALVSNSAIPGLRPEELREVADRQAQATLHNLALGKPIFEANLDGAEPEVKFAGFVR